MSEGPSGSPFPPPDLDPLLSQADETEAAAPAPAAPARAGGARGFSRRGLVGVLLAVAVVSAATLATTAALVTGKDSSRNGTAPGAGNRAAIAPEHVAGVSASAHRVAGASSSLVLSIEISVASSGRSVLVLLGGARFRDEGSTRSVHVHAGPNRVRAPLSAATPPGRYRVRILLETTAGRSITIERPFGVDAG